MRLRPFSTGRLRLAFYWAASSWGISFKAFIVTEFAPS